MEFRRTARLLNGDSHLFGVDNPLADSSSSTGIIHHTLSVPNLTRIYRAGIDQCTHGVAAFVD
jgi:hypothetical protein